MKGNRKEVFLTALLAVFLLVNFGFSSCRSNAATDTPRNDSQAASATEAVQKMSPPDKTLALELSQAFEYAAGKVSASIVPIFAETVVKVQNNYGLPDDAFRQFFGDEFFKRFFGAPQGPTQQTVRSLGSGVIVSKDGYILTNNHVVAKAGKLSVYLGSGTARKRYVAKVVGADPPTDLAVIRIDATDLPAASLGDSSQVQIGQWVIAVGNPFQLMHTVTAGIISAKGRSSVGLATYEDFFQTDAAINPGNSGGALADLDGNVIGINSAIETPSGGNIGIGFAIPINMAKEIMPQLIAQGKVLRGYLDLYPQDIDEDLAKALNLKSMAGVLVASVGPGGPADKAGLKQGDVITELNGKPVTDANQLREEVAQIAPGKSIQLSVLRNGKEMKITLVLGERPETPSSRSPQEQEQKPMSTQRLGLTVQTLTPSLANQLGYRGEQGVLIAEVAPGSPADDAGLKRGDLIKEIDRTPVRTSAEFEEILKRLKKGEAVALLVQRGQNSFFVALTVQ
jgi:serine protease Do